jgi:phage shock protein PspC (stress-responsive transcriptional regulator)
MNNHDDSEEPQVPHPDRRDAAENAGPNAGGQPVGGAAGGTQAPPYPGQVPPAGFFGWIRNLGLRRGQERWIGGVGSGIAHRLGIDPVIVRGLLVLLALFFGVGLLAYGVAWALLPEPDGRIHVEEVAHGHWSSGMTGAAIFTLVGLVGPGRGFFIGTGNGWFPWPILWIGPVVALVIWAMNRDKARSPRNRDGHTGDGAWTSGPQPYRPAQPSAGGSQYPAAAGDAGYLGDAGYPVAPSYQGPQQDLSGRVNERIERKLGPEGPLGPSGQRRPLKGEASMGSLRTAGRRHNHPGAAAVAVSTGLAVLIAGAVLLLNTSGLLPLGGYAAATAWAAGAITLGFGIVVSGLRGRTSGSLGFFAVVALLVAGSLSLIPHSSSWTLAQNGSWSPASISSAEDGYSIAMGRGDISLTGLEASAPLSQDVVVPVNLAAARVDVALPANIPVSIQSELAATQISVNGQDSSAATVGKSTTAVNTTAPGHRIILQLHGAAGQVNITISGSESPK